MVNGQSTSTWIIVEFYNLVRAKYMCLQHTDPSCIAKPHFMSNTEVEFFQKREFRPNPQVIG